MILLFFTTYLPQIFTVKKKMWFGSFILTIRNLRLREIKWFVNTHLISGRNWDQSLRLPDSNSWVPPLGLIPASLPPLLPCLAHTKCQPSSLGDQSRCTFISTSVGFKSKCRRNDWCLSHAARLTLGVTYCWGGQAFPSQIQTPESLCLGAFSVHMAERNRLEVQEN